MNATSYKRLEFSMHCCVHRVKRHAQPIQENYKVNGHSYKIKTFYTLTYCKKCGQLLKGLFNQGYSCSKCKICMHQECLLLHNACCTEQKSVKNANQGACNAIITTPKIDIKNFSIYKKISKPGFGNLCLLKSKLSYYRTAKKFCLKAFSKQKISYSQAQNFRVQLELYRVCIFKISKNLLIC